MEIALGVKILELALPMPLVLLMVLSSISLLVANAPLILIATVATLMDAIGVCQEFALIEDNAKDLLLPFATLSVSTPLRLVRNASMYRMVVDGVLPSINALIRSLILVKFQRIAPTAD